MPPRPGGDVLDALVDCLNSGEAVLGERLLPIGHGRPAIPGVGGAIVTLDREGRVVVIVELASLAPGSAPAIADALDLVGQRGEGGLEVLANDLPSLEDARAQHAIFFGRLTGQRTRLNSGQRIVLLVYDEPGPPTWKELLVELGARLVGVYQIRGDEYRQLAEPTELQRRAARDTGLSWPVAAGAILGIGLIVLAAANLLGSGRQGGGRQADTVHVLQSATSPVAARTSIDATHTHWIGQRRLLAASDRLLALYPGPGGLRITEGRQDGTGWAPPMPLDDVRANSVSAAVDDQDGVHLVFRHGPSVAYAKARRTASGWDVGAVLNLDGASTSAVVDVAYDARRRLAHLLWVEDGSAGQQLRWAAVSATGRKAPRVVRSAALGAGGDDAPVLANIAADTAGRLLVTYRRGDSVSGWFSRALTTRRTPSWGGEQRIPTEAVVGAATLAYDQAGTAHLVLRDSTAFKLSYFRQVKGSWSSEEVAVESDTTEDIELPSLSIAQSGRLYLFFQSGRSHRGPEVQAVTRDPARGWQGPYALASSRGISDGTLAPTSLPLTSGQVVVLWTRGGGTPMIEATRVAAL